MKSLSDHVVRKLSPNTGVVRSALELVTQDTPRGIVTNANQNMRQKLKSKWGRPQNEEEKEESLLPHLIPSPGTEIK